MTASVMTPAEKLPVPVLEHPHWRVNIRPSVYAPNRIERLATCLDVVRKSRVSLRGWDFPHIPLGTLGYGDTWVAGWNDFQGNIEYWRFYQSTQFLYLGTVREATDPAFTEELRRNMSWHAGHVDVGAVPGLFSPTNAVYNITEYFEFAARLALAQVYTDPVTIAISVRGIAGFMLAPESFRVWTGSYVAHAGELNYVRTFAPLDLIASAADHALACTLWLFERFGWLKPNVDAIRTDQQKLLTRQF